MNIIEQTKQTEKRTLEKSKISNNQQRRRKLLVRTSFDFSLERGRYVFKNQIATKILS